MKLVQLLPRWMVETRPLYNIVTRWLGDDGDDVLVLEHRYARCELHNSRQEIEIRLPAATLLSPTIVDDAFTWGSSRGFAFDLELGAARRRMDADRSSPRRSVGAVRQVVGEIEAIVTNMFDVPSGAQPVLSREPKGLLAPRQLETPEALGDAMRRLASSRSLPDRKTVYEHYLNHRHVVPLVSLSTPFERPKIAASTTPDDTGEVWVSFTNWSDALRWRMLKGDGGWAVLTGVQLVAMGQHLESLMINPGSRLGGEFYGHELRRIGEALRLTP